MRNEERIKTELRSAIKACDLHETRMRYAWQRVEPEMPFEEASFEALDAERVSLLDQWIYRYSRLQDTLGQKVMPLLLQLLAEDSEAMPLIDRLGRMEKLGLLSADQWLYLREVRNILTHEYPENLQERLAILRTLPDCSQAISDIWCGIREFLNQRMG